jgi:hypothetical protein
MWNRLFTIMVSPPSKKETQAAQSSIDTNETVLLNKKTIRHIFFLGGFMYLFFFLPQIF